VRPADAPETAAAWLYALQRKEGPTALILTRQGLPVLDRDVRGGTAELGRGGYVVRPEPAARALLLATGSEVHLALAAADLLAAEGIPVQVAALPCWEAFAAQPRAYREAVLPPGITARVAVEAGVPQGWHRWVGARGEVVGLDRFGASAPAGEAFRRLGFTPEAVAARVRELL
jgi:transketolase